MKKLRYYWFAIRWLYRNKDWGESRQKYKALAREYAAYEKKRSA